jgi:hypothetical protein
LERDPDSLQVQLGASRRHDVCSSHRLNRRRTVNRSISQISPPVSTRRTRPQEVRARITPARRGAPGSSRHPHRLRWARQACRRQCGRRRWSGATHPSPSSRVLTVTGCFDRPFRSPLQPTLLAASSQARRGTRPHLSSSPSRRTWPDVTANGPLPSPGELAPQRGASAEVRPSTFRRSLRSAGPALLRHLWIQKRQWCRQAPFHVPSGPAGAPSICGCLRVRARTWPVCAAILHSERFFCVPHPPGRSVFHSQQSCDQTGATR